MKYHLSFQILISLFISITILTSATDSIAGAALKGYTTGRGLPVGSGVLTIVSESEIDPEKNIKENLVIFNLEEGKFYYRGGTAVLNPEGVLVTPGDIVLLTGFNATMDQDSMQIKDRNIEPYVAVKFYKKPYVVVKQTKITKEGLYYISKNDILRFNEPKKIAFVLPRLEFGGADKDSTIEMLDNLILKINEIKTGCVDCKKSFVQIGTQEMSVSEIEN